MRCGVTSDSVPDDLSLLSPCVLTRAPPRLAVGHLTTISAVSARRSAFATSSAGWRCIDRSTRREFESYSYCWAPRTTQETLDRALRSGRSVGLSTGGVWEQLHTSHEQEALSLLPNLGFVRLAMRHGVPLVPTYAFGENALYKTHNFGMSWREWVALKLRVGLPLATGRLGGPFPRRTT